MDRLLYAASKIDVGLVLSEVLGDIKKHRVILDRENNKIKISCVLMGSEKEVLFSLALPKEKNV